jgi:hypothetical protein
MPRLIESLPKYRKHRASGQAVVTLCGVEFYLGPHGTRVSCREYDRLVGEWLAAGRQLPVAPDASFDLTIVELLARLRFYSRDCLQRNRPPPWRPDFSFAKDLDYRTVTFARHYCSVVIG